MPKTFICEVLAELCRNYRIHTVSSCELFSGMDCGAVNCSKATVVEWETALKYNNDAKIELITTTINVIGNSGNPSDVAIDLSKAFRKVKNEKAWRKYICNLPSSGT